MFNRVANGMWWDFAWSLVESCTPVSEACRHCWLLAMGKRFGVVQTPRFRADRLWRPRRRHKPTVYAIWSDLLHECMGADEWRQTRQAMALCPHVFLALTKRPHRIVDFMPATHMEHDEDNVNVWRNPSNPLSIAIKGLWFGTTCENQQTADERIPHLLKYPGKKFLSLEPLLGPIDLPMEAVPEISWVIIGCENAPKSQRRPTNIEWVRSIVTECQGAEVAVFVKQLEISGRVERDINLFPKDLQIRQIPKEML